MSKITAVEWLLDQIQQKLYIRSDVIQQAKEMEKTQIIDAVNSQRQLGWDEKGEQYYTDTYKGGENV